MHLQGPKKSGGRGRLMMAAIALLDLISLFVSIIKIEHDNRITFKTIIVAKKEDQQQQQQQPSMGIGTWRTVFILVVVVVGFMVAMWIARHMFQTEKHYITTYHKYMAIGVMLYNVMPMIFMMRNPNMTKYVKRHFVSRVISLICPCRNA